jgi:hypothetical protein
MTEPIELKSQSDFLHVFESDVDRLKQAIGSAIATLNQIPQANKSFWQWRLRHQFEQCKKELTAASAKANALSQVFCKEISGMSEQQIVAIARDIRFPMFRELFAHRDWIEIEIQKGRMDASVLVEIDKMINSYGREVYSETGGIPVPHTSAHVAIAALKEQREKLEALEAAAEKLENCKSK